MLLCEQHNGWLSYFSSGEKGVVYMRDGSERTGGDKIGERRELGRRWGGGDETKELRLSRNWFSLQGEVRAASLLCSSSMTTGYSTFWSLSHGSSNSMHYGDCWSLGFSGICCITISVRKAFVRGGWTETWGRDTQFEKVMKTPVIRN